MHEETLQLIGKIQVLIAAVEGPAGQKLRDIATVTSEAMTGAATALKAKQNTLLKATLKQQTAFLNAAQACWMAEYQNLPERRKEADENQGTPSISRQSQLRDMTSVAQVLRRSEAVLKSESWKDPDSGKAGPTKHELELLVGGLKKLTDEHGSAMAAAQEHYDALLAFLRKLVPARPDSRPRNQGGSEDPEKALKMAAAPPGGGGTTTDETMAAIASMADASSDPIPPPPSSSSYSGPE